MANKLDRFTPEARRALTQAQEEAVRLNHAYIGPEHLLLALMRVRHEPVAQVLHEVGVEQRQVVQTVEQSLTAGETPPGKPILSPAMKRAIERSVEEARTLGHHLIGVEHLLCGLVQSEDGVLLDVWRGLGIAPQRLHRQMQRRLLLEGEAARAKPVSSLLKPPDLTTDLVAAAAKGELNPLIGREPELARLIQMLCRRTKRSVLLVGKPGVGRRTLVNGLAQRMSEGNVPAGLLGRSLYRLDLDADGVSDRGMWRYHVSVQLAEIVDKCVADDAILFVDKLDKYMRPEEANGDFRIRLKLAAARANLQLIATVTPSQYHKAVGPEGERDWSLQVLPIEEPSPQETLAILRGIKSSYEQHHHVVFGEEALHAAVQLAVDHVLERFLPEKAIDLLDEAGSSVQLRVSDDLRAAFLELQQVRQQKQEALEAEAIDEAVALRQREVALAAQLDDLRATIHKTGPRPEVTWQDVAQVVAQWTGIPTSQLLDERDRPSQDREPPDEAAVP